MTKKKQTKVEILPKWLYYTALVIFISGIAQIMNGNLRLGIAPEKTMAMVLTACAFLLVIYNDVVGYFKERKLSWA